MNVTKSSRRPNVAARPTVSWGKHYPFEPHELRIGDWRLNYVDEGQGRPLLMVHGNPTWSFHWRRAIGHWNGDYRVVAPDHLGCGLSDKPADFSYRLDAHIDNLVELVERLDLSGITLVAHDWGGAIGLGTALRLPDRFSRITLLNTGAFRPWFIPWRIRVCRMPLLGRFAVQGMNLFARAALRMAMVHPKRLSDEERAGYLAPYDSWDHRRAIDRFVRDIPLTARHPTWKTLGDIEDALPTLADRPVQLIWGMRDWCFTPECLEKFIEVFPAADVCRIDDAGHWVIDDAWPEVQFAMDSFFSRYPLDAPNRFDDA